MEGTTFEACQASLQEYPSPAGLAIDDSGHCYQYHSVEGAAVDGTTADDGTVCYV